MHKERLRFHLSHLFAATAVVAGILTSIVYFPSTYQTDGDIGQKFIGLLLVLCGLIAATCCCFQRLRTPTLVAFFLICILFAFRQSRLIHRLNLLQAEVRQIITYVEKYKAERGKYPDDLSEYSFERRELEAYVRYVPPSPYRYQVYEIRYHPTHAKEIAHWYNPTTGHWYEDD